MFCRLSHALAPVLRRVAVSDGLESRGVISACIVGGSYASLVISPCCTGVMCGCCSGALYDCVAAGSSRVTWRYLKAAMLHVHSFVSSRMKQTSESKIQDGKHASESPTSIDRVRLRKERTAGCGRWSSANDTIGVQNQDPVSISTLHSATFLGRRLPPVSMRPEGSEADRLHVTNRIFSTLFAR
jgi:hypothetical protein